CRAALDRQREHDRERAARMREEELARAQLETKLARLADRWAELDRDQAAWERELPTSQSELEGARARLGAAEQAVAGARRAHAEAVMEHARARDARSAAVARASTLASELELWTERATSGEARLADLARRRSELVSELAAMADAPATLERQRIELEAQLAGIAQERDQLGQ